MSNENRPNEKFEVKDVDVLIKSLGTTPETKTELLKSLENERETFKALQRQKEQLKEKSHNQGKSL